MRNSDDLTLYATLLEQNDTRRQQIDAAKLRTIKADAMNADQPVKTASSKPTNSSHSVVLECAADVTPQPINWLWRDWLPAGKLTILAGAAGTGKTTLALAFAATVTRGGLWPDGSVCAESANVLIWSGEDDPADTIVPRLMLAGADLSRVFIVRNVANQNGKLIPFDPARDVPLLNERIVSIGGARLLIVDPVISAVSGDAHRANDVRRDLQSLVDLASAHGCAVIGISHFAKGTQGSTPAERVIGSQAFAALARMVLVTAKDESAERRILARAKANIAPDDGGFSYTLERAEATPGIDANRVVWGERIDGSAREILGEVERDADANSDHPRRDDAEAFLRSLLSDGPVAVKQIKAEAKRAGYAWRTIQRAKRNMGFGKPIKDGTEGGWAWILPAEARHDDSEDRHTDLSGGLRDTWRPSTTTRVSGKVKTSEMDQIPEDRHDNESGGLRKCDALADDEGDAWDMV